MNRKQRRRQKAGGGQPGQTSQADSAGAALEAAAQHFHQGKLAEAETVCRQILRLQANDALALNMLGRVLMDKGQTDEADACLRGALQINPDLPEAHYNLGNLLLGRGEVAEAVASFHWALKIRPDYAGASNNLGNALKAQGKPDEAAASYRRSLAIWPNNPEAHTNLGIVLNEQRKPDEAIACYRRAIEIEPRYAPAHNILGTMLKDQGKLEEAVACFRKALEISPNFVFALNNLASALQELGDLEGAVEYFERSRQIEPDSAPVHLALSAALETLGRKSEARIHLEESICREPILTNAYEGNDKPLATVLKLASLEKTSIWLEDGKLTINNGPINDHVLLGRDKFILYRYIIFEENLLKSADDLPHFDVVVNGLVNPDSEQASLATACQFIAQCDVPCINDPRKIAATTRENVADLLAGVDNLVVPRTVRVELPKRDTSLFMPIVEQHGLRFPLIVRPVGGHVGTGMIKIEREEDFANAVFFDNTLEFYLIEYHDFRSDDGYFRKMRIFFIAGKAYPYHLAISDDWLIHHHTSLMNENDWMRREEELFLKDHVGYLYGCNDLQKILQDINEIIGLDYFGLDCALLKSGELLLFESNPAMVVRLDDPKDKFAYKYVHVPKIVAAYEEMVLARARP